MDLPRDSLGHGSARTAQASCAVPTVLRSEGFRFFFYSDERDEPAHVHVRKGGCEAKFWLDPIAIARNDGFAPHELSRIQKLVRANAERLRSAWNDHHDPDPG